MALICWWKEKLTWPWQEHPHPRREGAVEAEEGTRKLTERSAPEEKFRCKPVLGNQRLNLVVSQHQVPSPVQGGVWTTWVQNVAGRGKFEIGHNCIFIRRLHISACNIHSSLLPRSHSMFLLNIRCSDDVMNHCWCWDRAACERRDNPQVESHKRQAGQVSLLSETFFL